MDSLHLPLTLPRKSPSSRFFNASKSFSLPLRRPHLTFSAPSRSHGSCRILNPRISTSDPPSVAVPEADAATSGEKVDWYSHWYPLVPVCDLDKRAPRAVTVLGLDVVVWWDREQGRWRVFDDRCPHRLAPLSEGRIDQWGRLQCVYHGWCFDGEGSCKLIPQAPADGPPIHTSSKACVASYPCTVQNNILWFWPKSDPQHKDVLIKCKPHYISELDDPSYTCTMGMRDIPYGYEILIENLMDPAHVPYAHYKILKIPKRLPSLIRYVPNNREGGVPLEITIDKLDVDGFLVKNQYGNGQFVAPCIYYSSQSIGSSNGSVPSSNNQKMITAPFLTDQKRFILIFYCIPVGPGRSRLIYVFSRNFAVWIDQIVPRWIFHVGENLVIDSDLYLLHVEERKIAESDSSNWQKNCFVPTKSDAIVTAFRRWLKKHANSQIEWANKTEMSLYPIPPREQLMDRYWSHVVSCSSCSLALKRLRVIEVSLSVISVAFIGIVAVLEQNLLSPTTKTALVVMAVICFAASKWLSHFIYKTFYFHDYKHAFV